MIVGVPMGKSGHKWFAAVYDRMMAGAEDSYMEAVRREMLGGIKGNILEIGCGTGANLPHYDEGVERLIASEPDPYMMAKAMKRARDLGLGIEFNSAAAETLPFGDGTFDVVVSTLVLCSVRDPSKALSEVRRVLKSGGEFRFYEHVRYRHAFGGFWQDIITPIWRWFGAGCHPNRDIERLIEESGFHLAELERLQPFSPIPPMAFVRPHIRGVALAP